MAAAVVGAELRLLVRLGDGARGGRLKGEAFLRLLLLARAACKAARQSCKHPPTMSDRLLEHPTPIPHRMFCGVPQVASVPSYSQDA